MTSYRLAVHPAEYYRSQFRPDKIEIVSFLPAGHYEVIDGKVQLVSTVPGDGPPGTYREERPAEAMITIAGPNETEIHISWSINGSEVIPAELARAESVVELMAKLDGEVASQCKFDPEDDDEPYLSCVEISTDLLKLHYAGTSANWSMHALFQMDQNGTWLYRGIG